MKDTILDIQFLNAKEEPKTLKDFSAQAYLVVNVASECGLTPQYEELEALNQKYKDQGLMVIGFPSNDFAGQEPGTNEEIQKFCSVNYNVSFPVNAKIQVKGEGKHPLYQALTNQKKEAVKLEDGKLEELLKSKNLLTGEKEDIHWNFEKFLVNSNGEVVERFFPDVTPLSSKVTEKIEDVLKS